jgi:hypothetical protein
MPQERVCEEMLGKGKFQMGKWANGQMKTGRRAEGI